MVHIILPHSHPVHTFAMLLLKHVDKQSHPVTERLSITRVSKYFYEAMVQGCRPLYDCIG